MIVLSDTGFHAAEGDPTNLKLCQRGAWEDHMQSPRNPRRNELPAKRINRTLLMGHQYLTCTAI